MIRAIVVMVASIKLDVLPHCFNNAAYLLDVLFVSLEKSPTNGICLQLVCLLSGATIMRYRPHMVFRQALPSVFMCEGHF